MPGICRVTTSRSYSRIAFVLNYLQALGSCDIFPYCRAVGHRLLGLSICLSVCLSIYLSIISITYPLYYLFINLSICHPTV
jgi:hypothetical protein